MSAHLLLLEPDPLVAKMLAFLIGESGYRTTTLPDPRGALPLLAEHSVDLILLDATLPHIDGFTLCTALRRAHPDVPVIFLSARCVVADRVAGLQAGADDYLAKPCEPAELLARIQAVLRRYRRAERNRFGSVIRAGDTALDLGAMQFTAPGQRPALLTPTEMKILECLMRNANAVIARETLVERTWGCDFDGVTNRVDVYISRLRKKIDIDADPNRPAFLRTVRDMGYTFRPGGVAARPALRALPAGGGGDRGGARAQGWSAIGD